VRLSVAPVSFMFRRPRVFDRLLKGNTVPATPLPEVIQVEEQERADDNTEELDQGTREALAQSVLEGPGAEAPRDELVSKADEEAPAGGRLDDLDEVAEAARSAEQQKE
jgi:hypothetical protein